MMITGHYKHVHVLLELSPKCVNALILGNSSELGPGKSEIEVVIQNRSIKDVKFKAHTKIGSVIAANIVPTTQVSNNFDLGEQERVSSMSAQVGSTDILGKIPDGRDDPKDILQKLNLSRMEEWEAKFATRCSGLDTWICLHFLPR